MPSQDRGDLRNGRAGAGGGRAGLLQAVSHPRRRTSRDAIRPPSVKITGIEARSYSLPLDPPFNAAWDPQPRTAFDETIVVVETGDRARGFAGGAPVPDVALLESLLIGLDPTDTDRVFQICQS